MSKLKWIIIFIALILFLLNIYLISSTHESIMNPSTESSGTALEVVKKFNEAFNNHDVDAIMNLMTDDCVFENTRPAPDGERIEGKNNVRNFWIEFFERSPKAYFETEEIFASDDRCVVRWIYTWVRDGKEGHVRGVDIFKIRNGKVAEKFSYVKG